MAAEVFKQLLLSNISLFLRELHIHLERENGMANNDSVLPLYVPDTDELEEVFTLAADHNNSKNRFQFWSPGRTVQWQTTWYPLA